ncbi:hypothetical protein H6G00_01905 [Leptolyngbya sp. FACHB-541]|uniref:hypothetical protein n=1 Tax=Leptolyngbya sp. FACHB-541 TaxID=2692810 RepID=UPI0016880088|nr:hypothetical protein [Leptolyngbya sp. FACHB-541]MBD1995386.1 hypothetical protein [Leptolyngbya sp. FACHB-541]
MDDLKQLQVQLKKTEPPPDVILQPIIERYGQQRRFWGFRLVNCTADEDWIVVVREYLTGSDLKYWLRAVGGTMPEGAIAQGKYASEMLQHLIVAGWTVQTTEPEYLDSFWFADDDWDDSDSDDYEPISIHIKEA